MSFLTLESIRSAVGGVWVVEPEEHADSPDSVAIDTRADVAGALFVALVGDRHDGHAYLEKAVAGGARALMVERSHLPATHPRAVPVIGVEDSVRALSLLARAWRAELSADVLAITGSAGKTTIRRMLESILERTGPTHASPRSFNNHIGVPMTILGAPRDTRFLVIEIGTNAPGEVAALAALARPRMAVITNVFRAHMEGFGSLGAIAREKASLLKFLPPDGMAILPAEDTYLDPEAISALPAGVEIRTFGRSQGDVVLAGRSVLGPTGDQVVQLGDGLELRLHLPGEYNAINACAVVAAARALGISDEVIATALTSTQPDPMRLAPVLMEGTGTMILNDVYNANPDAVLAALAAFAEISDDAPRRVVILGDMLELGPEENAMHAELGRAVGELVGRTAIDVAVFIGERSAHGADALAKAGFDGLIVRVPKADEMLLDSVAAIIQPGDAVLVKASRGMALERVVDAIGARSEKPVGELARG